MQTLMNDQLELLLRIAEGDETSAKVIQSLTRLEACGENRSLSFGIKDKITIPNRLVRGYAATSQDRHNQDRHNNEVAEPLTEQVAERLALLQRKYGAFCQWCDRQGLIPKALLPTLWQVWLPLAQGLMAERQRLGRPLIQGVLGMQGAGKTTMGGAIATLLEPEYSLLSFSIDDIYKPWADRRRLREADPRLLWRGPPGTHDVALGIDVLQRLRRCETDVAIPVFDKALAEGQGDRIEPRIVPSPDIVLFDGWFVGVQPIEPQGASQVFQQAPDPITTEADRQFAQDCNERLREYLPLWAELDGLIVLALSDFQLSKRWRIEAEQRLRAEGRGGMSDREVSEFVDYFWKALHPALFVEPLLQGNRAQAEQVQTERAQTEQTQTEQAQANPSQQTGADLVIEVGEGHSVQRVYRPLRSEHSAH